MDKNRLYKLLEVVDNVCWPDNRPERDEIIAEFDRLGAEASGYYDEAKKALSQRDEAQEELKQTEYRRMNWQQTAEAHANCAESQGKKVATLQGWLDRICEPVEVHRRYSGILFTTDDITFRHREDVLKEVNAYLDSQKPSEKPHHNHICLSKADCPTCNPKCEHKNLGVEWESQNKRWCRDCHEWIRIGTKPLYTSGGIVVTGEGNKITNPRVFQCHEWEQSPQDINLIHKYFYET